MDVIVFPLMDMSDHCSAGMVFRAVAVGVHEIIATKTEFSHITGDFPLFAFLNVRWIRSREERENEGDLT